ncbi:MAG: EAL domain-containing protein [Hyphomicrobiaceae bacterium]
MKRLSRSRALFARAALSWKLPLLGLGTALIATIWIAVGLQIGAHHNTMVRAMAQETANLALVFEQSTDRTASEIDRILKYLRSSYERNGHKADWPTLVQEEFTFSKRTVQIAVIDRTGMMITSSKMLFPEKPIDLSDREHFRVHKASGTDELFISRPVLGRASHRWSVQFTRPFRDSSGAFAGVLVVSLDPDYLTRSFGSLMVGEDGGLAIVGTDGIVRAGAGIYSDLLGQPLPREAEANPAVRDSSGILETIRETASGPLITASRQGRDFPLKAVITRSDAPQYIAWRKSRQAYVAGGGLLTFAVLAVLAASIFRRRRIEKRLSFLASYDPLTRLLNRTEFAHRLAALINDRRRATPFALHLIDLDNFKDVNDTYGHPIGDAVLVAVGQRLRRCVRQRDMVARLGGDEFAVIQLDVSRSEHAEALGERLCRELAKPHEIEGVRVEGGASIGILADCDDARDSDQLMRSADLALYAVKNGGGGNFRIYDDRMNEEARARREIEIGLRAAIVGDQLEIHYQPINSIAERSVTGVEALIRWRHPVKGLIPPGMFIPVAEQTGLIVEIGSWVLQRACVDIAECSPNLSLSVNVSAIEFRDSDVAASVESALRVSGLPPSRLIIEITESLLMKKDSTTLRQLEQIRQLGVRVALDDFGTGYSSLSYLQTYAIDIIKIDQTFVRALGQNKHSRSIIDVITSLARCMGMTTVAEGVETEDQLSTLAAIGCDKAQGYFFSKPRPLRELDHVIGVTAPRSSQDGASEQTAEGQQAA